VIFRTYYRITSKLQTIANKGYNPLIAIQIAFAGEGDLLRINNYDVNIFIKTI